MRFRAKLHVFAGICTDYARNRAFLAQIRCPVLGRGSTADQAALFLFAPSKVVPIKIFAFKPIRRSHGDDYTLPGSNRKTCPHIRGQDGSSSHRLSWLKGSADGLTRSIPLDAGNVFTRAGINSNGVPFFDKHGYIYGGPGFGHDFLRHARGGVAANCNIGLHNL